MYARADSFDLTDEIQRLSTQVEKTTVKGARVPPGLHAHLGYLCSLAGDNSAAAAHFEAEKRLFPESARLMDRLLEGLR
jgi:hypothetical protein